MHYKIAPGVIIKTENAAKPVQQASKYLTAYIANLTPVLESFDYGCGKLRYQNAILETTDTLAVVDSEIQLSRTQAICRKYTTIRSFVERSNRVMAYSVEEFECLAQVWDRAFCINVLSTIPFYSVRQKVINLIRNKLRSGGECLFVLQYRNSDFTRMKKMPNARKWRDGFLLDSLRGFSFYALISPESLKRMVTKAGFEILDSKLNDGSVYLYARVPKK